MDIARVLARIADGNREAFAEVVETYQRPLFGFLGRMGMTQAVAAEVAQETFMRAWQNLEQYRPERAEFSTWLFSIARNLALNELTRAGNRRDARDQPIAAMADTMPLPVDSMAAEQAAARLRAALCRLPNVDRTALALVYVRELPLGEVAALEGTSVGALKVRLHRARLKLREWLENADD